MPVDFKTFVKPTKYVNIKFDPNSLSELMDYCKSNGLDVFTKFNGLKSKEPIKDYHITVIFSNNQPNTPIKNNSYELPNIEIIPESFDLFGENKSILVLRVKETDELKEIRNLFVNYYDLKEDFPDWSPHISLTYNYEGKIPEQLPNFKIYGKWLNVEDNKFYSASTSVSPPRYLGGSQGQTPSANRAVNSKRGDSSRCYLLQLTAETIPGGGEFMARPRSAKQTARCTSTLDLALVKRLESIARAQDVSVSWMIRRAIEDYLKLHDEADAAPQLPLQRIAPRRNR